MRYKDKIARAMAINAESIASANTAQLAENVQQLNGIEINVMYPPSPLVACKVDGVTNDTVALQAIQDFIGLNVGGTIYIPQGICVATLQLDTNVKLKGAGWLKSFIKCPNNAGVSNNNGVVQTRGFNPSATLWNYYTPYPTGISMGVQIEDICIDGNAANNTTGNGLCLYGGKFLFRQLAVINVANHGIWSITNGISLSSTQGNYLDDYINMHESTADTVFICNAGNRGWFFEGPNDSRIDNVQIKTTGGAAFWVDGQAWCIKIGTLHMYFTNQNPLNTDTCMMWANEDNIMADRINIDTPKLDGIVLNGSFNVINTINVLKRNPLRTGAGCYAVRIVGNQNIISKIISYQNGDFSATGTSDGGDLYVSGNDNVISSLLVDGLDSVVCGTASVVIAGNHNTINWFDINGYSLNLNSKAIKIIGNTNSNYVKGTARNCYNGAWYENTLTANQLGVGNEIDISTDTVLHPLTFPTPINTIVDNNMYRTYDILTGIRQVLCCDLAQKKLSLIPQAYASPDPTNMLINGTKGASFRPITSSASFNFNLIAGSTAGDILVLAITNTGASPITVTFNVGYLLKTVTSSVLTLAAGATFGLQIICLVSAGNWLEI